LKIHGENTLRNAEGLSGMRFTLVGLRNFKDFLTDG
jgi:hypothetical protein